MPRVKNPILHRLYCWRHPGRTALLGWVLAANASAVLAALGQAPSHFAVTAAAAPSAGMRQLATQPAPSSGLYTVHETPLDTGTTVREYATPAGVVFAVAWRGPVLPDLSILLGQHFQTFNRETEQARQAARRGSPVNIGRDDLVVRSFGRMRNFFGHAYVPSLVPAGVNINDVLR